MSPLWKLVRTIVMVFVVGFLALFLFRLGYGYWVTPNGQPIGSYSSRNILNQGWKDFAGSVKNYASKKRRVQGGLASVSGTVGGGVGDQKYEKVASVALKTRAFEDDEARVRSLISKENALIQFEQREGLKGRRLLRLAIGVDPKKFDPFVASIQTYGELSALTINKSDKTNEYRELKAKRVSLEKTRSALSDLKSREGKISEMITLEKQMLDLERQIQALGVNLGDFDSENEFVTVKMLMREVGEKALRSVSLLKRSFTAFVWAVETYCYIWFALACAMIAGFIGAHLVRLGARLVKSLESGLKS